MANPSHLSHDWFDRPLPENVTIGERSWLYSSFAFRHYCSERPVGLQVGHDTGLYNGTFFDLGPSGGVTIGNYCTVVGGIFATNRSIHVGDYVLIAHEVVIADESGALPWDSRRNGPPESAEQGCTKNATIIGDGAWIAARACIVGSVEIGTGAIVGAGAVVDFDVPPFSIVAGNPAKITGWQR